MKVILRIRNVKNHIGVILQQVKFKDKECEADIDIILYEGILKMRDISVKIEVNFSLFTPRWHIGGADL
jgi:hypothetical protein